MKALLVVVLSILFLSSYGQDTLVFKTRERIVARVLEIGISEIKYKKFDNQDGPIFTVKRSDVLIIRYPNGTVDIVNKHSAIKNEISDSLIAVFKHQRNTGIGLTVTGGILIISGSIIFAASSGAAWTGGYNMYGTTYGESINPLFVTGIVFMGISTPFLIAGPIMIGKSINTRREAQKIKSETFIKPDLIMNDMAFIKPHAPIPSMTLSIHF